MADKKERQDQSVDSEEPISDEQLEEASGGATFPGHTRYPTIKLERAPASSDEPGRLQKAELQGLDEISDEQT